MTPNADEIKQMLARVSAGELDELTPQEIDQLEQAINEDDALSAQVADISAGTDWPLELTPSDAEWDQVWQGVTVSDQHAGHQPVAGWWLRPVGVAAAVVALLGAWSSVPQPSAVDPWLIQPDTDFEIVAFEAGSDATPFIIEGGDEEFPVVWVIENEGA